MQKTSSSQRPRLQSTVALQLPALEKTCPPRNSALPAPNQWRLDPLGKKPQRLSDTQRRRLRQKRAKQRNDAHQAAALQALDKTTRTLILDRLCRAPDGHDDRECRCTSSGDPSGGATPFGYPSDVSSWPSGLSGCLSNPAS